MTEKKLYKTKSNSSGNYKTEQSNKTSQAKKNEKSSEVRQAKINNQSNENRNSTATEQVQESKNIKDNKPSNESDSEKTKGIENSNEVRTIKEDNQNNDDLYKELQIEETKNPMNKWWCDAIMFIGGTIALGFLAKLLGGKMFDFNNYEMPPATAPSDVFPFIWIVIYIAIGVSTYLMWRDKEISKKDRAINLALYIVQMIFNVLWPWFFFRCDLPVFAVFWLLALIGVSFACMYRYFICNLPAGIIFNIYSLWLIYALYLNLGLVLINFVTI